MRCADFFEGARAGRVKYILLSLIMPDTWFYRLDIGLNISNLCTVDNKVDGEVTEVPGQGSDGGGHSVGLARWTHTLDVSAGTKKRKIQRSRDTGLGLVPRTSASERKLPRTKVRLDEHG